MTAVDLNELRASNAERLVALENRNASLSPIIQLKLRLDVLTAYVLHDEDTALFEQAFEQLLALQLDAIESELDSTVEEETS